MRRNDDDKQVTEGMARDTRNIAALSPEERSAAQGRCVKAPLFDIPTGRTSCAFRPPRGQISSLSNGNE